MLIKTIIMAHKPVRHNTHDNSTIRHKNRVQNSNEVDSGIEVFVKEIRE